MVIKPASLAVDCWSFALSAMLCTAALGLPVWWPTDGHDDRPASGTCSKCGLVPCAWSCVGEADVCLQAKFSSAASGERWKYPKRCNASVKHARLCSSVGVGGSSSRHPEASSRHPPLVYRLRLTFGTFSVVLTSFAVLSTMCDTVHRVANPHEERLGLRGQQLLLHLLSLTL